MKLIFEWDEAKARENLKKHKVDFNEGKSIFGDPFLLTFPDVYSSERQHRRVRQRPDSCFDSYGETG
jgi:uncharacterized DUF497 family protein